MRKRKVEVDPVDAELDACGTCCVHSHPDICWELANADQQQWLCVINPSQPRRGAAARAPAPRARACQDHRQPARTARAAASPTDQPNINEEEEDQGHDWEAYARQLLAAGGIQLISANTSGEAVYGVLDYNTIGDRLASIQVTRWPMRCHG